MILVLILMMIIVMMIIVYWTGTQAYGCATARLHVQPVARTRTHVTCERVHDNMCRV